MNLKQATMRLNQIRLECSVTLSSKDKIRYHQEVRHMMNNLTEQGVTVPDKFGGMIDFFNGV